MKAKKEFTIADALKIQRQHLKEWKKKYLKRAVHSLF
jgi:hypothetical protein